VPFFVFGGIEIVCASVAILALKSHTPVQSETVAISTITRSQTETVVPNEPARAVRQSSPVQRSPYAVLRVPACWLVMMASLCTSFAVAVLNMGLDEFLRKAKYDWLFEALPSVCESFFLLAAMIPLVWLDQRAKVS
jgi:hypothetical protein